MIDENACRGSWTLGKSGILICAVEEKGGSAAWSVNHGWFALWYLQLSQNWRLPSVKISDFVTAMYRGIDTLIGYVLFRPRSPANQTSRSLSSIQTIYTILEPPCSTCPFPYPFLDHIQIWTKTRRNETLSHRVEIVDRLQSGVIWSVSDSRREETTRKERKFRSRRSRGDFNRWRWEIVSPRFESLLAFAFRFSPSNLIRDVNSGTIIVSM